MAGSGTATATVTRWSRTSVAVGVGFFLAWQVAVAAGLPRAATVPLGVYGFVFHVVFGKAYTLVPSYVARELAVPLAPAVHPPFALFGALEVAGLLASLPALVGPGRWLSVVGAGLSAAVCWTIFLERSALTG